ncbi:MAG TPA: AAA family ATPase [Candidatus Dormibacteraeota bacterium]
MDRTLRELIERRLYESPPSGTRAADLVLAAYDGPEALHSALASPDTATRGPSPTPAEPSAVEPPGAYLRSVTVEGFRGVGPPATLRIDPGPGLTLVVGRNGSGKSSFSEALEILLTGHNQRWEGRSKVWSGAWRNLHHEHTQVTAEFLLEGASAVHTLARSWPDGAELEASTLTVNGTPDRQLDSIGWRAALATHRPFLTHNEVGTRLDARPSDLHDALAGVLGLEDVTTTARLLAEERLTREKAQRAVVDALGPLRARLEAAGDERARACLAALAGRSWNLDALASAIEDQAGGGAARTELTLLEELSRSSVPAEDEVAVAAVQLDGASRLVAAVGGTDADRARRTARLLQESLELHTLHGDADCPVCGAQAALNPLWRITVESEVARLRREATEADAAHAALARADAVARRLLSHPPASLQRAAEVGLDAAELIAAWQAWADGPQAPAALGEHLLIAHPSLARAAHDLSEAAAREILRRQDLWRPVARDLTVWLEGARRAEAAAPLIAELKAAERWLKDAAGSLREERFRPIADLAQRNWSLLRQQSSVDLGGIRLEGASTQRRVSLDVTVDGAPGPALGVMSQGELNCLSLSLFLPRALLPESPFRFVAVDDPVQAMDPAKIDGLARCLAASAERRQVIVFTHDERLPEAVRYLGIPVTVLQVTRRERSQVEIRPVDDPVARYIQDALAVARTEERNVHAARVVPGFCRSALEAACMRLVRERRLRNGRSHEDIEREFAGVTTVNMWMALALVDDVKAGNRVIDRIRNRVGAIEAEAFERARHGAHEPDTGDLVQLTRATERLTRYLATLP